MTNKIPIEDFFEDILGKAMRGLGKGAGRLAGECGTTPEDIQQLLAGSLNDPQLLRTLALRLDLDPDSLVASAKKEWYPRPVELEGLAQFNTPWHDMRVNAYLVWDPGTHHAAAFDTGTDAKLILSAAQKGQLQLESIFITHTHGDHIADLDTLTEACGSATPVFTNRLEALPGTLTFEEGRDFAIGNLKVHTLTTSGHSPGGTSYFIEGLAQPVAIVGDAMFAGSMGGGIVSYQDALENNRHKILTLPDNTILCPGHGPMSTIGEEKAHNPFFPEFK
jgi:glyoxylase-like metal-dependent hydrolase (beta-lactamase superfamily II)